MKSRKFTKPPIPRGRAERRHNDERVKSRDRSDRDQLRSDKPTVQELRADKV